MTADLAQLNRYYHEGDCPAFAAVVAAHGGMVFATARRIVGDAALAEDVAQEVFLDLARRGQGITQSLAGWLHRSAIYRAKMTVRGESRRHVRESDPAADWNDENANEWHEIEPLVDELLDEMPENLRSLLVEHFLEQRTQRDIAQRHRLSQSTVSRQIESGLQLLRAGLKAKGITCGLGLAAILTVHTAHAAPATLSASLGKIAMSGIGTGNAAGAAAASSLVTTTLITMTTTNKTVITLCLLLCLLNLWSFWTISNPNKSNAAAIITTPSQSSDSTPTPLKAEKAPTARKPLKIASKGKVRLKPGESAVLGYWEIAPGMNGMAIVTPETTPEGLVKMSAQMLHMPDAAVADADAHDLFPDLFDSENYSAIGPERLRELQSSLRNTRGVDMLSTPALVSHPGQQASISIGNLNEFMLSLGLQADPVVEDGGYDLSLDLQRQE